MDELVKTFHIDWKLLIAQIINFGIVLGILWYFALKPLMKVMNKRNEDIEQSLKNAEEIEKRLKAAGESKEQMILEAKKESQVIMEN
ncbi:ATP synthase F0 subunit B, partial [Patescibacteria group bacterium]|nr:ATP synthase F0 subunit B [Patescibacteria group bacterium]